VRIEPVVIQIPANVREIAKQSFLAINYLLIERNLSPLTPP
jgi:hypothetical protein